jgi:hypothetical protein
VKVTATITKFYDSGEGDSKDELEYRLTGPDIDVLVHVNALGEVAVDGVYTRDQGRYYTVTDQIEELTDYAPTVGAAVEVDF